MRRYELRADKTTRASTWAVFVLVCLCWLVVADVCYTVSRQQDQAGQMAARLGFLLPVVVVCLMMLLATIGIGRSSDPKWFLWVAVVAGAVGTLVIPFLALGASAWDAMLPAIHPAGFDFRVGLYDPAAAFSTASSIWPPFTLVVGLPFVPFSQSSGYVVFVVLLAVLGIASTWLSARLGLGAASAPEQDHRLGSRDLWGLFLLLILWMGTSYGFLFEVERGQLDLFALFFSLLSVWWLFRFPRQVWLPSVFLAIAINLKLYPAIFVVLLFWRFRWRALIPLVVSNAALFLSAGPANAWRFLSNNFSFQRNPISWAGSNSAYGFADNLHYTFGAFPVSLWYVFLAVPCLIWLGTAVILIRRGWDQRGAVLLAAASVPLMCVIPSYSADYKLVLMVFPLAVLAAFLVQPVFAERDWRGWRALHTGLLGLGLVLLTTATMLWTMGNLTYPRGVRGSKYPLVVLVQVLLLGIVLLLRRKEKQEAGIGSEASVALAQSAGS